MKREEREKGRKGGGKGGEGGKREKGEEREGKGEEREGERGGKRKVENGEDEISPPPTHLRTHTLFTTHIPTYTTSISQMRYQVPTNPAPPRAPVPG